MILTSRNEQFITQLEKAWNIDIDLQKHIAPTEQHPLTQILKDFPNMTVVVNMIGLKKKDWKLIPRLLTRKSQVLFFASGDDWLVRKANGKIKMRHGRFSDIIEDINIGMKRQSPIREHLERYVDNKQVMHKIDIAYQSEKFKNNLNIIIQGLDINMDLFKELNYKTHDRDLFYAKMLYAIWWKRTGCDPYYVREFTAIETDEEQTNPKERAEHFAYAVRKILNRDVNIHDIYEGTPENIYEYTHLLKDIGIEPGDTLEEMKAKAEAHDIDIEQFLKGSPQNVYMDETFIQLAHMGIRSKPFHD